MVISGSVDPSSPQFQAALQACRKFLPGGGPPAQPAKSLDDVVTDARIAWTRLPGDLTTTAGQQAKQAYNDAAEKAATQVRQVFGVYIAEATYKLP